MLTAESLHLLSLSNVVERSQSLGSLAVCILAMAAIVIQRLKQSWMKEIGVIMMRQPMSLLEFIIWKVSLSQSRNYE